MSLIRELKRRNVVRMALFYLLGAWVVLQVADVVVGVAGLPDWTLRLVGLVLLLGLPLALVFSWVYRLTPEGLRKDISIDDSGRRVVVTPVQRLILVASFAVIVAGGYVLIDRFMIEQHQIAEQQAQAQGPTRPENVVMAVMPFEVHGEEPESDEPRQRVRRAVARMIERLGDIRVVPEERVLALEGTDLTDPKLAEELSATHIVHGREWHSEEGTRFAVRLMDPTSGERLWAMEFERPLVVDDEMQPEAWARLRFEINRALSEAGLTDMTLGTESVTAMQALEKAGRSEEPERWYREALMLDPEFAEAHVEFAFHLANQTSTGVPWQEIGELATEHAKRAFELESDSPEVNAVLSRVLRLEAIQNYNSESAEHARLIERSLEHALAAVQSAPRNLNIRLEYIRGLWAENQWDEVVEQLEILRSYAPGAGYLGDWMINPLLWAGKIDEAEALLVQLKSEFPDRDWAHSPSMHTIHRARGDLVSALEVLYPIVYDRPDHAIYDYFEVLFNIGALDAIERWVNHVASLDEGQGVNLVWGQRLSVMHHQGQYESAASLLRETPAMSDHSRFIWGQFHDYTHWLHLDADDPAGTATAARIRSRCEEYKAGPFLEANREVDRGWVNFASDCFLFSTRIGEMDQELGDAMLAYYETHEPPPPWEQDRLLLYLATTQAAMGDVEAAVVTIRKLYGQGFTRHYHFRTFGIVPDLVGVFNGLGSHPELLAMIEEMETSNAEKRADIEARAPWLLDPAIPRPEPEPHSEAVASG